MNRSNLLQATVDDVHDTLTSLDAEMVSILFADGPKRPIQFHDGIDVARQEVYHIPLDFPNGNVTAKFGYSDAYRHTAVGVNVYLVGNDDSTGYVMSELEKQLK